MNSVLRDPETPPRRVNILCVDDESSILSSLRRALRRVPGYQIHIAPSGAAGLAVLDE
ncbi:MAG: two-component system response regulator, partial [Pseudomonadota bacterium]